jgi:hypothetical protein
MNGTIRVLVVMAIRAVLHAKITVKMDFGMMQLCVKPLGRRQMGVQVALWIPVKMDNIIKNPSVRDPQVVVKIVALVIANLECGTMLVRVRVLNQVAKLARMFAERHITMMQMHVTGLLPTDVLSAMSIIALRLNGMIHLCARQKEVQVVAAPLAQTLLVTIINSTILHSVKLTALRSLAVLTVALIFAIH